MTIIRRVRPLTLLMIAGLLASPTPALAQPAKHVVTLDDLARIRTVGDPQRSPDGKWVAYTVTTVNVEKDKRDTDIWMVSWDGAQNVRLTSSPDNEPRRAGARTTASWRFSRAAARRTRRRRARRSGCSTGPAARRRNSPTSTAASSDYSWSPDGTRLVFTVTDKDPADEPEKLEGWKRKTDTAHRHRPLPLQAGPRRLPAEALPAHLGLRHRCEEGRADHEGSVRGQLAGLVARRHADRLHQLARRRSRTHRGLEPLRGRGEGRCGAEAVDDVRGQRRRPAGVEPRRAVDRVPPGRRAAPLGVSAREAGHRPGRGRRAEGPHDGARPRGERLHLVVGRRQVALLHGERRPRRATSAARPRRLAARWRS